MRSAVLGIDTCSTPAFVAVVQQGQLLAASCAANECHAENLVQLIDNVLTTAGRLVCDLECIAVAIGPGSFTGIRTGIAAAQGLAAGLGIKLIGISSLLAQIMSIDYNSIADFQVNSTQEASPTDYYSGSYRCLASGSNSLDVYCESPIGVVPKSESTCSLEDKQSQFPLVIERKQLIVEHNPAVLTARAAKEINCREQPDEKSEPSSSLATQYQILMPNEGQQGVVIKPLYVKSCSAKTIAERRRGAGAVAS